MKMTKDHQTRVGFFMTIGLIVLCLSIFFLGGRKFLSSYKNYKARFPQIQGLQIGSIVSLTGINIGNITSIDLVANENIVEVTLKVEAEFANRITEGSEVDIRTQGALGDKFIFIKPGLPSANPLPADSILPVTPSVDFMALINDKGDQASQVFDIISDIHKITKSLTTENQIGKILLGTEVMTLQLKKTLEESEKLVKDLRGKFSENEPSKITQSMNHLENILNKIDKGEGTLGALIKDPTLHEKLKQLLGADSKKQEMRNLFRQSINSNNSNNSN